MSYPHVTTALRNAAKTASPADIDERLRIQARVRGIQHMILDVCERIVAQVTPEPQTALTRIDERRQFANMLRAHEVCATRVCRRKHACLGEPRHCLRVVVPALGIERLAPLIGRRQSQRSRAKAAPMARV